MVSYVKNYIQDQAIGYLHTGITAAGTMAGNAVGGVGGLIENGGRSIGEGIAGSINGVGGYINNYGDGIRSKFAADGYVGKSASQKAKNEPSEATKPYGLKKLPDASSAGNLVTGASRKILPGSAQPKPSAAATKQVRSAGSVPVGATKKVGGSAQKALPAPASKTKAPPAPKPVTNTRPASAPPTKRAAAGAASKPPPGRVNTSTPKPVQPKPGSTGANTNKPSPVAGGKVKVSAASRPRATKKPIPA